MNSKPACDSWKRVCPCTVHLSARPCLTPTTPGHWSSLQAGGPNPCCMTGGRNALRDTLCKRGSEARDRVFSSKEILKASVASSAITCREVINGYELVSPLDSWTFASVSQSMWCQVRDANKMLQLAPLQKERTPQLPSCFYKVTCENSISPFLSRGVR